jgi:itaconate CoA-transferase
MELKSLYESKLTTPADAVGRIASGATLSMGMAMTEPPALLKALADRAAAGKVDDLKIYYFESTRIAGESILRYELADRIHPYCMFVTAVERALIKKGEQDGGRKVLTYVPSNFSQSPRFLTEHIGIDTFLVTVSPMDRHGYFTFGTGNDYSSKVARAAKHLMVEVNNHMPRVYGSLAQLHVSEVETIVENNVALMELPVRASGPEDAMIGKMIAEMVPDGACLQMGVGALPDLVCSYLRSRKDLGIHTEALCPGMIDLIDEGVVTNRRKRLNTGKTVFTFAMGQKTMYDFLDDNPSVESHPVDYVNDPFVIAQNDNVVSINAALQIDYRGPARLRAWRLRLPRRQVDHRLPLDRGQGQGVAHRRQAGRPGDYAAHGHAHRRHGIRLDGPQRQVIDGARQSVDRPGASGVSGRAHGSGQGDAPDLRRCRTSAFSSC